MAAVAMTHYPAAAHSFQPPLIAHDNHFLGDISSSEKNDPEKPIVAGIYVFKPGQELEYAYHYDEMKIILEGKATLRDATGQEVEVCFFLCFLIRCILSIFSGWDDFPYVPLSDLQRLISVLAR